MNEEIENKYSTYVHIGNSGYTFEVTVEETDGGQFSQHLTTSLHAFGHEHETKLWLDGNIIAALEYILECAKKQRSLDGWGIELSENYCMTHRPSHMGNDDCNDSDDCDNSGDSEC